MSVRCSSCQFVAN
ncbi:hypothetical protein GHO38_11050 [Pseudomonas helleri]|nr:hypothetical protein [Pseudomonas helleri]